MIYISELQQLIDNWTERIGKSTYSSVCKEAVSDCIYELNSLVNKALLDEMTEQDALDCLHDIDADYYSQLLQDEYYATAV